MRLLTIATLVSVIFHEAAVGFSITSCEVIGDGKGETHPALEGTTVTLRCSFDMAAGEEWTVCQWSHGLREYDDAGKQKNIQCIALPFSQGQPCSNQGGSSDLDVEAQKIKMDVSPSHCSLIITDSDVDIHDGPWDLRVSTVGTLQIGQLDLYMANYSTVRMIEPDAWADNHWPILYDLGQSRPEIWATCRGYGGSPQPTFQWFINDDSRKINPGDYTTGPIRSGTDPLFGSYVEESITFSPSYEKLCEEYNLGGVCNPYAFIFDLICKTNQDSFYVEENKANSSKAVVVVLLGGV